jgi:hypothetical protein
MTVLKSPLNRKIKGLLARDITISIYPHGVIGFKEGRSRQVYYLPILTAYRIAIDLERADRKRKKQK